MTFKQMRDEIKKKNRVTRDSGSVAFYLGMLDYIEKCEKLVLDKIKKFDKHLDTRIKTVTALKTVDGIQQPLINEIIAIRKEFDDMVRKRITGDKK